MFFYTRYPSATALKEYFSDVNVSRPLLQVLGNKTRDLSTDRNVPSAELDCGQSRGSWGTAPFRNA